jgi:cardiolipin synthase
VTDPWFLLWLVYISATAIFLVLQNRRPQASLAWMLSFMLLPVVGPALYVLFGRDRKGFSRARFLERQEPRSEVAPSLARILADQNQCLAALEEKKPAASQLLGLVRESGFSTMTIHNDVEILQDAAEKYPRLIGDLEAAKNSIHLQYYIWASDEFTDRLKNVLLEKARAGVEVRLLYDPVGSFFRLKGRYVRQLRKAGAQVRPSSQIYAIHTLTYRNHRKIAVIDGCIGYTGGLNIGQEHVDGGGTFRHWRDTHMRVVGEAATILQAVFAVDWQNATGETLTDASYFPDFPPELEEKSLPVQIVTSGPDSAWRAVRRQYFSMIVAAQRRFYAQSPFFILDETIAEALKIAALSGIDVRIMVSRKGFGNWIPYWAANTFFLEVVESGVRVFLYDKGYLHSKTAIMDTEICSIGTANIDIRSFSTNYELNTVIYDTRITEELAADFERDLQGCTEFTAEGYRRTSYPIRLRDSVARLFSPLL